MEECLVVQTGCCFGGRVNRLCCSTCPSIKESTSTRLTYTFLFLGSSIIATMLINPDIQLTLLKEIPGNNLTCSNSNEPCSQLMGYTAVYRVSIVTVLFFSSFAITSIAIKTSRSCRANIHNGFWGCKLVLLFTLIVAAVTIPSTTTSLITTVWFYITVFGETCFTVVQYSYLMKLISSWSSKWIHNGKETKEVKWFIGVISCGMIFYILFVASVHSLLFQYTTPDSCLLNASLIIGNVSICIIISIITVLPFMEKKTGDARSNFLQSAVTSSYVIFITWSALTHKDYGKELQDSDNLMQEEFIFPTQRTKNVCLSSPSLREIESQVVRWISVFFTYFVLFYASFTQNVEQGSRKLSNNKSKEDLCEFWCPTARNSRVLEDDGGQKVIRNEADGVVYNYTFFLLTCSAAALNMSALITNWYIPPLAYNASIGGIWLIFWSRVVAAWLCIAYYLWSIVSTFCQEFKTSSDGLCRNLETANEE